MGRPRRLDHLPIICGIYKITAPDGKINVGQSHDVHLRLDGYQRKGCKGQWKLHQSLVHFGWDAHAKEIVQVCESSELNHLEKYHSEQCGSFNTPWALNLIECGGSQGRPSIETRKKQSESHLGNIPWNKGLKDCYTEEQLKDISNGIKLAYVNMSEERRKEISIIKSNAIRAPYTEEHCRAISEANKGPHSDERKYKSKVTKIKNILIKKGIEPTIENIEMFYFDKSREKYEKLLTKEEKSKIVSESSKKSWAENKEERKAKSAITRAKNKALREEDGTYVKITRTLDIKSKISKENKRVWAERREEILTKCAATRAVNKELIRQEKAMMIF